MDLDADLIQLQGALIKANNIYQFKRLEHKGGNEKEIYDTVQVIKEILVKKGYLNNDGINKDHIDVLRRINLFLIFNADIKILDVLVQNDDIGHLIWISPTISKCLLIHMVWGLYLDEFYCEVMLHCPDFSLELVKIAVEHMKYVKPQKSIKKAKQILTTLYLITKDFNHKFKYHNNLQNIMHELREYFYQLLKFYTESNNKSKIANWDNNKLYLYAGEVMINILELLIDCFTIFLNKNNNCNNENLKIYLFECSKDCDDQNQDLNNYEDVINDQLLALNKLLIEIVKTNIMSINVDMFCSWSEFNITENKTVQNVIGELAYKLHNLMESDERLESDLISMLSSMSIKPKDINDLIQEADKDELLLNSSQRSEDQSLWLTALAEKEYIYYDQQFLVCIYTNLDLLSKEIITKLFKLSVNNLYNSTKLEFRNDVKQLALSCLNTLDTDAKKILILDTFQSISLSDKLELQNYDEDLLEFLNKLIKSDDKIISRLFDLFIQNPVKFYTKIFDCCSKNPNMLPILNQIVQFKDFYSISHESSDLSSMILNTLKNIDSEMIQSQADVESYIMFINEINKLKLIDGNSLLLNYIVPSVDKYLINNNYNSLLLHLQCLKSIFDPNLYKKMTLPMLIMCAQIMENVRWDLNTFTTKSVEILEEVINIQTVALNNLMENSTVEDNGEHTWLIEKLRNLTPLNLIYYNKLLKDKVVLISNTMDRKELMICLSYMLPRIVIEEWKIILKELFYNRKVSSVVWLICDVVKLICFKTKELNSQNAYYCLDNCCRNLSIILQEINYDDNDTENLSVLKSIIGLLNSIPDAINDGCFNCLLNPLSKIINLYKGDGCDKDIILQLIDKLYIITHKELLKTFLLGK